MEILERARKNEKVVLRGLASVGQVNAAKEINLSESAVSRMKDGEIAKFSRFLAACNLKVVPVSFRCAKPEVIEALQTLARSAMNQPSLAWDD